MIRYDQTFHLQFRQNLRINTELIRVIVQTLGVFPRIDSSLFRTDIEKIIFQPN